MVTRKGTQIMLPLFRDGRRVVRNGAATNDLVLSAYADGNESVFPRILDLYVRPGSVVADVTYGKGVFWRNVEPGDYDLRATDLLEGVDCRDLPYRDGEIDCVVLDPPYMHSPGGTAHSTHRPFEDHYRNNESGNQTASKYHEAVLDLYRDAVGRRTACCANAASSSSSARTRFARIASASGVRVAARPSPDAGLRSERCSGSRAGRPTLAPRRDARAPARYRMSSSLPSSLCLAELRSSLPLPRAFYGLVRISPFPPMPPTATKRVPSYATPLRDAKMTALLVPVVAGPVKK